MSDSLDPSGNCQYCNDLKPGRTATNVPFDDWVSGISSSPCQTCQIVAQAIRKLNPQFLKGEFDGQTAGSRPNTYVRLSADEKCRVCIGILQNGRSRREVDIQLYHSLTDTGMLSETPQIGIAGDISLIPGDAQMWSFLQKCLNDCHKEHEKCKAAQDSTWYPERLLRLTQDESSQDLMQLIQTQHNPPSSPYITLSHCWGSVSPFCTTKKNISGLLKNIPLLELPRTFQDCVVAAHELGVQYIWIDSLCIIQDDRKDWARHSRCMDKIYENALFTVAAVSSPSGWVPFLGPEALSDRDNWQGVNIDIDTASVEPRSAEKRSVRAQLKARRCAPYLTPTFFHGPLEDRGWAWQERYLSVRIINFTKEEVRWHCKMSQTCECIGAMQSTNSKSPQDLEPAEDKGGKQTLFRQWRHIVTQYSKRQLTYSTDRLPALSGVASRFYCSLQSEYFAGLWLADFPRSLAWYRRELSDCPTGKPEMWCSLDNVVPSWSWASIFDETNWLWDYCFKNFEGDVPLESQVELISTSCRPSSDNIFGEVEEGSYIKLRGKVVEAEIHSDIHGCACVRRNGFGPQHVIPDCHIISTTTSSPSSGNLMKGIQSRFRPKATKSNKTTRRAVETDILSESLSKGKRSEGHVCCLLLFTTSQDGKSHACVLILGKQAGSSDTYQRLGIGNSDPGWSRPLYKTRKDWEVWEGWEELEEWEEWEGWFADAEVRTLTII